MSLNPVGDDRYARGSLSRDRRAPMKTFHDEMEHAVGPIRVGRMFIHQGDSVDESYHVENMDIRSDLFCVLGAELERSLKSRSRQ